MHFRSLPGPEHRAEAPRVPQAQDPGAEIQVDMIVLAGRGSGGHQAQAARHAQVQDQVAVAAVEQQVFAAPQAGTGQRRRESRTVTDATVRPTT